MLQTDNQKEDKAMRWHAQDVDAVLQELESVKEGLSEEEARKRFMDAKKAVNKNGAA